MDFVISSHSLLHIRQVAAVVLAASVKELFPNTLLVGGGATSLGFYYDFAFPFVFQAGFLSLIEEKMTRLIKQKKSLDFKEMVPVSAKGYFLHKGEPFRAAAADVINSSLVEIVSIGDFCDLFESSPLSHTGEIGAVKLKSFEEVGKRDGSLIVRIWGAASFDKQSLKDFLKKEEVFAGRSHTQLGQELDLFSPYEEQEGLWLWHPKGQQLKEILLSWCKQKIEKQNFSFIGAPPPFMDDEESDNQSLADLFLSRSSFPDSFPSRLAEIAAIWHEGKEDGSCGLLRSSQTTLDVEYVFCKEKQLFEECISSLQFMSEMLKILGFEFHLTLSARRIRPSQRGEKGKKGVEILSLALQSVGLEFRLEEDRLSQSDARLEFCIKDALDREWPCSFIGVTADETRSVLIRSVLGSLERIVALLLERHEGLPFWLAPEQVRLLGVSREMQNYVNELEALLRGAGFRVGKETVEGSLKERIHKGMKEKVPFVLLVGEKEQQSQSVMLRMPSSQESKLLTIPELMELLKKQTKPE